MGSGNECKNWKTKQNKTKHKIRTRQWKFLKTKEDSQNLERKELRNCKGGSEEGFHVIGLLFLVLVYSILLEGGFLGQF
jgi:hypothetical protein